MLAVGCACLEGGEGSGNHGKTGQVLSDRYVP